MTKEQKEYVNEFAKERDKVFINAVKKSDWQAVRDFSKKYGVPIPKDKKVMKAGIYKAVQYCTNIPDDVKALAMQKCLELGFNPFIAPIEEEKSDSE